MDNTNESQEFDLDDILREFHEDPDDDVKDTASEEELDVDVLLVEEVSSPAAEQPEAPETAEAIAAGCLSRARQTKVYLPACRSVISIL